MNLGGFVFLQFTVIMLDRKRYAGAAYVNFKLGIPR